MPANLRNASVGATNRANVARALLDAGFAGLSTAEITKATGLCPKSVAFYCHTIDGVTSAGLSSNHHVRWFHPLHQAGRDAYKAEIMSRHKKVSLRWSSATLAAAAEAVEKAGDQGASLQDVVAVTGKNVGTINSLLVSMVKAGQIQRRAGARGAKRYYGLSVVLPEKHTKRVHKQAVKAAKPAKPKVKRATVALPKRAPKVKATAPVTREIVIPAGLKVTVCPSGTDNRFKPDRVEPFFSALAPGNYLRTGSAIERAYEAAGEAA